MQYFLPLHIMCMTHINMVQDSGVRLDKLAVHGIATGMIVELSATTFSTIVTCS